MAGLGIHGAIAGVLADLGVSSLQLETPERGFSFRLDGPLDMRMGLSDMTAADLVNQASEGELETHLQGLWRGAAGAADRPGDRPRARTEKPIETTGELQRLVAGPRGRGRRARSGSIPATRVFQALRIEVNQELAGLERFIEEAVELLETDGRLVVISYHSLEDRIVKNTLRDLARGEVDPVTGRSRSETQLIEVLTRKPVRPTEERGRPQPARALRQAARGPEALKALRNAYAFRRPVVNSYLVRERDRRRVRELALVLLVVLCLGGGLLAYTWIHLEVTRTGYRIDKLERELTEQTREERQLRLEAAYLASPSQIERRAVEELGMQPPAWSRWSSGRSCREAAARHRRRLRDLLDAARSRARLYHLQVVRYDHYSNKAERQQQRVVTLDPPRGTIYDAQGRELAVSIQVDSVYAVPPEIEDPAAAAARARRRRARARPRQAGAPARRRPRVHLGGPQARSAGRREGARPGAARGSTSCPRASATTRWASWPPRCSATSAPTTTASPASSWSTTGRSPASRGSGPCCATPASGTVAAPDLSSAEPEPGHDLYLTLDATVQHIVERELARAIQERHAKRGSAIFLDPATGGVLAMASYPTFDPNEFGSYRRSSWRNRAIADVYEPGSTFKIITAAAALEAGVVRRERHDRLRDGRAITLFRDIRIRDHKPYGMLTFAQVIAQVEQRRRHPGRPADGRASGSTAPSAASASAGRPGIDLPGESAGILHPSERWRPARQGPTSPSGRGSR